MADSSQWLAGQHFSSSLDSPPSINPALLRPLPSSANILALGASGSRGNSQIHTAHRPMSPYSSSYGDAMLANRGATSDGHNGSSLDVIARLLQQRDVRIGQQDEYVRRTLDKVTAGVEQQRRIEYTIDALRVSLESKTDKLQARFDVHERVVESRMDEFQARLDDMQTNISDFVTSSLMSVTDKTDAISTSIVGLSTSMIERFNRSEHLQTRLGESVKVTRDEIHSDKEAIAEFHHVQAEQMDVALAEIQRLKGLVQYAFSDPMDDVACNQNDFVLDCGSPQQILARHPLSKMNLALPAQSSSTTSPLPKANAVSNKVEPVLDNPDHVAKAENPPSTPDSHSFDPASVCLPETVPDENEVDNETLATMNTLPTPPASGGPTPERDSILEGTSYDEPAPESAVRFERSSSPPHPTNGDLPPAPFGPAVRGPARFDLHIERSPSPLTSIASSDSEGEEGDESSDSSDEDDESVDQTLPRGGVSQTAGAGPSTFPPPKRTSSELKEGRMHKCPNGYAGCLKTFKHEGDVALHIQDCTFSQINFTEPHTPSKRGSDNTPSSSPITPLRVKLKLPRSTSASSQPLRKKRRLDAQSGGVHGDGKLPRGRPRKSNHLSQPRTKSLVPTPQLQPISQVDTAPSIWPSVQALDDSHDWTLVQCDKCDLFYHFCCVGIQIGDVRLAPDAEYVCPFCANSIKSNAHNTEYRMLEDACNRPDCGAIRLGVKQFAIESLIGRAFMTDSRPENATAGQTLWLVKWGGYPVNRAEWQGHITAGEKLIKEFNAAAAAEGIDLLSSEVILLREAREDGWTGLQHASRALPNVGDQGANPDANTFQPT